MNDPNITIDEMYNLNDAITRWAEEVGLRKRRGDDTDDMYDSALNRAVLAAVNELEE